MIFTVLLLILVRDPMVASLRPLSLPGPAPEGVGPTPASGQPSCKKAPGRHREIRWGPAVREGEGQCGVTMAKGRGSCTSGT